MTPGPRFASSDGHAMLGLSDMLGFAPAVKDAVMALSGTLIDHNQPVQVTGLAWMDHQWGNFLALGGGGWDWYSIQLNNDTEMMLYVIRDAQGRLRTASPRPRRARARLRRRGMGAAT